MAPRAAHLHNKDQESLPPTSLSAPVSGVLGSGTPHPNVLPYAVLCSDFNLWLACEMSGFFFWSERTNYVSK